MPLAKAKSVYQTTFGETVGQAIEALAPEALPVAGMTIGAAVGAPAGPGAASAMAGAGAGAGEAFNILVEDVARYTQGQPPVPLGETLTRLGSQFTAGASAQAVGTVAGALMRGAGTAPHKLREMVSLSARGFGIELTAAEQTGSRILGVVENISKRSLGAGPYEALGRRQAAQLIGASERTLGVTTAEAAQTLQRSQRFLTMLEGVREKFKLDAGVHFNDYLRMVGGPKTPLGPDDLAPFFAKAEEIRRGLNILPSMRNAKLVEILKNIKQLEKRMSPETIIDPKVEPVIRKQLGLGPTEDLTKYLPNLMNNPQFAQFITTKPARLPTLEQVRKIRADLGDLAFPDRLKGAVTVDAPIADAERLWSALATSLEEHALARGGDAAFASLKASNQFYSVSLANLDARMYTQLLGAQKDLPAFSRMLFNPHDPGPLMGAKAIVSDEGWKLLQQQYVDDVLVTGKVIKGLEGGGYAFDGRAFAERIGKDLRVLDVLYPPETVKALRELAEVARVAAPTSNPAAGELVGILIASGQGAAIATGLMQGGLLKTAIGLAPYGFAKIATNPTGIKVLTNVLKGMNAGRKVVASDVAQTLVNLTIRTGASAVASDFSTERPITIQP